MVWLAVAACSGTEGAHLADLRQPNVVVVAEDDGSVAVLVDDPGATKCAALPELTGTLDGQPLRVRGAGGAERGPGKGGAPSSGCAPASLVGPAPGSATPELVLVDGATRWTLRLPGVRVARRYEVVSATPAEVVVRPAAGAGEVAGEPRSARLVADDGCGAAVDLAVARRGDEIVVTPASPLACPTASTLTLSVEPLAKVEGCPASGACAIGLGAVDADVALPPLGP